MITFFFLPTSLYLLTDRQIQVFQSRNEVPPKLKLSHSYSNINGESVAIYKLVLSTVSPYQCMCTFICSLDGLNATAARRSSEEIHSKVGQIWSETSLQRGVPTLLQYWPGGKSLARAVWKKHHESSPSGQLSWWWSLSVEQGLYVILKS